MPMPMPPLRRHAVLQRPQEVLVELHGLGVAAGRQQRLRGQPGPLLDRVDQLGVTPSRSRRRTRPGPTSRPAAGRRDAGGSAATPRPGSRVTKVGSTVRASTSCSYSSSRICARRPSPAAARRRARPRSCAAPARLSSGVTSSPSASDTASWTGPARHSPLEVDLAAVRPRAPPCCRAPPRRVEHQLAGQRRHRVVVAVRLVDLEHRELGVVGGVDALVAEDAADLVDPLEAADDQPLEVELDRDAQVQLAGRTR